MVAPFLIQIAVTVVLTIISTALNAQNIEQGKIDDINTDSGSHNETIVRVYGRNVVKGKTIWIANDKLIERVKKKKILFGIGGSVKQYSYFATFGVVLTTNPVHLRRIWASNKLIYDGRSTIIEDPNYSSDYTLDGYNIWFTEAREQSGYNVQFQFREGYHNQGTIPYINEAEPNTSLQNFGGSSVLFFKDLPLKDFGNRIPELEVEVKRIKTTSHLTASRNRSTFTNPTADKNGRIWYWDGFGNEIVSFDPLTNQTEVRRTVPGLSSSGDTIFYNDENNTVILDTGTIVDVVTGAILHQGPTITFGGQKNVYRSGVMTGRNNLNNFFIYDVEGQGIIPLHTGQLADEQYAGPGASIPGYVVAKDNFNFGYTFTRNGDRIVKVHRYREDFGVEINVTQDFGTVGSGVEIAYLEEIDKYVLFGGSMLFSCDPDGSNGQYVSLPGIACNFLEAVNMNFRGEATAWIRGTDRYVLVDFSTLTVVRELDASGTNDGDLGFLNIPGMDAFLADGNPTLRHWDIVQFGISSTDGETVQEILEDLADFCDIDPSMVDFSAGSAVVAGMVVSEEARKAMDRLVKITGYDVVEEDGKIKLVDRNNPATTAIARGDMGTFQGTGEGQYPNILERVITEPTEAPERIELSFPDADGDYSTNMVVARQHDDKAINKHPQSISTNIALTANQAQIYAHKLLAQAWRQRDKIALTVPFLKYPQLNATDVILVPDGNDFFTAKIENISGFHALEINAMIADPTGLDTIVTSIPEPLPVQQIDVNPNSEIVIIDSNLPLDTVTFQDGLGFTATPVRIDKEFTEVSFMVSRDNGETYEVTEEVSDAYGVRAINSGLISATVSHLHFDMESEIIVDLPYAPITRTREELTQFPERNLIFVQAGDDWEIMQFATVTSLGGDQYSLTGFWRGRRGTEPLIDNHGTDDFVIFYDPLYARGADIQDYNVERLYAAVLDEFRTPIIRSHTSLARGLRPYAPTYINFEQTGPGNQDIVITWKRRSRLNGKDVDGQDVPLNETSENYDIEIVDSGSNVVRTLTSTSQTVTYNEADLVADLGLKFQPFSVNIYQVSDEVGRGFPGIESYDNFNTATLAQLTQMNAEILVGDSDGAVRLTQAVADVLVGESGAALKMTQIKIDVLTD